MYLKSVEIYGFKSFANKLLLTFNNGITGVVGPNGSGKSNVADALRWVFGEQSAKELRGSKMEDVIFSGTETRKPQSFAYVAITIDNSDKVLPIEYNEVVVARRVYRSGESEYLLNGHNCRLKDVEELFFDTGIGKEGYSIIGQGQVERIINSRPENRRELFDEAAGITKFKKRKADSIKKLAEENDNLSRVNDIISELKRQLEPLKEQSETARKYLIYKEELKKYEIANFVKKYDYIEENRLKTENNKTLVEKNLSEARERYENIKQRYVELEAIINEKSEKIDKTTENIAEKELDREKLEGEIRLVSEKISQTDKTIEETEAKLNFSKKKLDTISEDGQLLSNKRQELLTQETSIKKELESLDAQLSSKNYEKTRLEQKKEIALNKKISDDKEKEKAKTKREFYKKTLEENKLKRLELTQKASKNQEVKDRVDIDLLASNDKIHLLSEKLNEISNLKKEVEVSIDKSKKDRKNIENSLETTQKRLYAENARLNSYRSMTERYEGYGNTIKAIMEYGIKGIIGVVADIIRVNESYETAVETAIGSSIRSIVTDTEKTAKQAITRLKEQRQGRATFLPLDAMETHKTSYLPDNIKSALNEKGIIGLASSLVEYDERYMGLVNFVLGRTLVAENVDMATQIARKYRYSLRIVTLQGEQLSIGGAISGGSFKNSTNFLGRGRELEKIKSNVETLEATLKSDNNILKDVKSLIQALNSKILTYGESISEITVDLNTEINLKKQLEGREIEVEKTIDEINSEIEKLNSSDKEIKSELSLLEVVCSEDKDVETPDLDEFEGIIAKIKELDKKIISIKEKISEFKIQKESISTEKNFIAESINRNEKEKKEILGEINRLDIAKRDFIMIIADKREKLEILKNDKNIISEAIKEKIKEKEKMIVEKEKFKKNYDNFFVERESISELQSNLDKELFRLTSQLEKFENEIDSLLEYMLEEYNLTYSEAVKHSYESENLSTSTLKKLINNQKNLLKSLGNVNINAIEEYREVSDRYKLLVTQAEDIRNAEDSLKKIIKELDKNMREQFRERFNDINEQFNLVFKELFGGGEGRLELIEGEDILESGIRIIARPPGKKLQNMLQLSGGEKALTSISLIFAIQNLKPSPFCILDEIEAALDESNVVRFAKYLQKLTDNTQFIVITHRRGTMNVADTLYGITMQEKGVSTMVSVDFEKSN